MSPAILRRSGPDFTPRGQSEKQTPRALIQFCADCNYEGAAFGDVVDGKREFWCGWRDGQPVCIGKGRR